MYISTRYTLPRLEPSIEKKNLFFLKTVILFFVFFFRGISLEKEPSYHKCDLI